MTDMRLGWLMHTAAAAHNAFTLRFRAAHCPPPPAARESRDLLEGDCVGLLWPKTIQPGSREPGFFLLVLLPDFPCPIFLARSRWTPSERCRKTKNAHSILRVILSRTMAGPVIYRPASHHCYAACLCIAPVDEAEPRIALIERSIADHSRLISDAARPSAKYSFAPSP